MAGRNPVQSFASTLGRRLRQERGVVLIEFALVLPILLTVILGIVYFGRYEDYANQETQLASEAVRYAAVDHNPVPTNLQAYIKTLAQPELQNGSSYVNAVSVYIYYPSGSTGAVGQTVRACVFTKIQVPLGFGQETMTETATERVEQAQTSSQWTNDSLANVPANCPTS